MGAIESSAQWLSITVFLCTFLSAHSINTKVHEHMTVAELQHVFQVKDHNHVPEYHLVQLTHHLSRRNVPEDQQERNHQYETTKQYDEIFIKGKQSIKDITELYKRDEKFTSPIENINDASSSEEIQDREFAVDEQETDVHKIDLEAFGKQIKLVLKKQEGLVGKDGLRMWRAQTNKSHSFGIQYEELNTEDEEIGELYHDDENGAALLIRRHPKSKNILVEGSIGDDLVIKALPDSMTHNDGALYIDSSRRANMHPINYRHSSGKRYSTEQELKKSALRGAQHVIIKSTIVQNNTRQNYAYLEPHQLHKKVKRELNESTASSENDEVNSVPDTVYPEILIFANHTEYARGGAAINVQRYFLALWNAVSLRFKQLTQPKIRFTIVGIILETPFLQKELDGSILLYGKNHNLIAFSSYLMSKKMRSQLPQFDIAVAYTKAKLINGDEENINTLGVSWNKGACSAYENLITWSNALVQDNGGFSGILTTAHELGHLLGAYHDGNDTSDKGQCNSEDSYLMTPVIDYKNERKAKQLFYWSPCSIRDIQNFLKEPQAQCLYNLPYTPYERTSELPGQLMSLDVQCQMRLGPNSRSCDDGPSVCSQLHCWKPNDGSCSVYGSAADGSSCGQGMHCISGSCVPDDTRLTNTTNLEII